MLCEVCKQDPCRKELAEQIVRDWERAEWERKRVVATGRLVALMWLCVIVSALWGTYGCSLAPVTIDILPDVEGNHEAIETEVREGLEFYTQERDIDDPDYWLSGLTIEIRQNPEDRTHTDCKCVIMGMYVAHPRDLVWVMWFEGLHRNAFFHEILHREIGDPGHSKYFLDETARIKTKWQQQEGY